jgi:hypothetical protein
MVVGFTTIHFYRRYFARIKGKKKYDTTPYPWGKAFLFVIMFISVRLGSISVICIVCQFYIIVFDFRHSEELIKRLEQAGLGYHVDADKTTDRLGIFFKHLYFCSLSFKFTFMLSEIFVNII